MNFSNVTQLLGAFYPEPQLKQFLDALGFHEKPRLPRDSTNAHLLRHDLGIEIIFTGERYLDQPMREYPEGALVFECISFYGAKDSDFSRFDGPLPHALEFGLTLKQLSSEFGQPAFFDEELALARWDLPQYAVFANFDHDGCSDVYSFQMPVSEN